MAFSNRSYVIKCIYVGIKTKILYASLTTSSDFVVFCSTILHLDKYANSLTVNYFFFELIIIYNYII